MSFCANKLPEFWILKIGIPIFWLSRHRNFKNKFQPESPESKSELEFCFWWGSQKLEPKIKTPNQDVTDHLETRNSILGGTCFRQWVHREQFDLHLGCGRLHHEVVDLLGIFVPPFLLIVGMVVLPLPFRHLNKVGRILRLSGKVMVGSLNSRITNAASGPSNFRRFVTCLEMASRLRLMVDTTLAVPTLLKIMCSRPCVGAANNWSEGAVMVELRRTFNLGFLLGLGRLGSRHWICSQTTTWQIWIDCWTF